LLPILDNMSVVTGDTEGQRQIIRNGEESTGGGPFGDILNAQGRPPAAESGAEARQEPALKGGNVVQPGGKELPDTAVTGPEETAVFMSRPAAAADAALLPPELLPPVESLPHDKVMPTLETSPGDKTNPAPDSLSTSKASAGLEVLSMDRTKPLAQDTGQLVATASRHSVSVEAAQPQILPGGGQESGTAATPAASVTVGQAATAVAGGMAPAMTAQLSRASIADKPVPVRVSEAATAGVSPEQLSAVSKLTVADVNPEGIYRAAVLADGRAPQPGVLEATRLRGAAEPATRIDITTLDGAPAVSRERSVLEAADILKGLEPIQAKQPAGAQAQPLPSSIPMPASVAELSAGLKMSTPATMTTPVGDSNWHGEFLGRVSLLVKNGMPEATLQLSPPELGRLEIKIATEGDQARIQFVVQSTDAKEAIEQAMPRLREMLEQSGLQLAHSEVADFSQSRQGESLVADTPHDPATADVEENMDESMRELVLSASGSTVDYYV
jgi:flagellar hook-length control protein FliK